MLTKQQLIILARDAGADLEFGRIVLRESNLETFATAVAADARESCAKACEAINSRFIEPAFCAATIRSLN